MTAFDLARIQSKTHVARVDYHEQLGSTNTRALELAVAGGMPLPLLVLANQQQAGRGRGQNRWWAADGALTFSLLIDGRVSGVPQKNWPLLSLASALAVAEVVEHYLPVAEVRIKWPNDVYVNKRKLSGILVETSAIRPDALVIGVGINVNNSLADAPVELQSTATSLVDLTARTFDRTEVLISVLQRLLDLLPSLHGDTWQLAEAWRERCFLQGRTIKLDSGGQTLTGICQGIDDEGALLMLTDAGIQRCFGGVVVRVL